MATCWARSPQQSHEQQRTEWDLLLDHGVVPAHPEGQGLCRGYTIPGRPQDTSPSLPELRRDFGDVPGDPFIHSLAIRGLTAANQDMAVLSDQTLLHLLLDPRSRGLWWFYPPHQRA